MIQVLAGGSENLFYLAYGMPQSRTSRRAVAERSSVINIFNKSTHKVDIKIGKFNAGQIIDDFKTRKSYKN